LLYFNKHPTEYSETAKPPSHAASIKRQPGLVLKRLDRTELLHHLAQRLSSNMNSQRTHQTAQPFSNQAGVQRSELNHLLRNFPDGEAQNLFSYLPNQQIPQTFLQPSYDSLTIGNGFEDYAWPDQLTTINQAVGDLREPLQTHTSVQLQNALVDHATDSQGLRLAPSGLDDRLASFEDRISGLETAIQNLRNE